MESAHLHEKGPINWSDLFRGDNFLTPVASRQPLLGACRPLLKSGRASPLLQLSFESLADADDAALMRLFIELRILVNDGKHVDQMHIGNDIQLYTDMRITDHFLPSFKSFNRCTYILQFHVPPVSKTHHIFSRNRFLARKPCVAASSVDLCDVFGWKYDTVVCKFNVKQCI